MHDPEGKDADHSDDPANGVVAPVSVADVADEVARAEARAAAARARLARLRAAAEKGSETDSDAGEVDDEAASRDGERRRAKLTRARRPRRIRLGSPRRPRRPRWLRRPKRKTVAAVVGIVLFCASVGASIYIVSQHRAATHKQQLAAEFTAAAREGVTVMMSIDATRPKADVQRIIDISTGEFKNQISAMSALMVQKAVDTKVSSKGTVEAIAVVSLSDDSAVLLVAARSDITNADNTHQPPAMWRMSVGITRDTGQLKLSKVDFL
ncbi:hypothetical protein BST27_02680 [Mycobacterium intermedium]|uniref:Mammalian cell entry protein n=1 Tax=Mycobacterium intermedium TaxID=28445 RepID=A0A1T3WEJ7_MYCIE|nr:hypothetical protein [Mycobacterium intermedium]MCV6963897.1 hypothetical protein [Mycobacterium intermedium]OPE52707.1 hypothetical protein BV508_01650 [Mycobacterium intermedium]ORB10238.1 hypothetical protein BST27_02680 [Mycobacterium intermedium]